MMHRMMRARGVEVWRCGREVQAGGEASARVGVAGACRWRQVLARTVAGEC